MSAVIRKDVLHALPRLACRALLWLMAALAANTVQAQTTVEYIHTDALGTPVAVTDAGGNVIERSEYAPYGELLNRPLADEPGYTGHVQDAATGLTYMQQRYYDPEIGRFLSVDPVEADPNSGGLFNRYMYAANNPYAFFDPDGRCTGSRIENGDGTCVSTGDFTTMGGGPTMPGAQTVLHQASIEAQAGVSGAGGVSGLYAANDGPHEPLYCSGVADCDFMYNQNQFLDGKLSSDEFLDRTQAQGAAGTAGAAIVAAAYTVGRGGPVVWFGVYSGGKYISKNVRIDGPSPGLNYANGRVIGISLRNSNLNLRLDYAPVPGSKGTPVLHINFGKSGRGAAPHIVIWDPRWYTPNTLK